MIYHGDALTILKTLPDESVHCCVTDPPYELGFMGKKWDKSGTAYNVDLWREVFRVLKPGAHLLAFGGSRTHHRIWCAIEDAGFEVRDTIMWVYGSGFPKSLDVSKAIDKEAGAEREVLSEGAPVKRMIPGADQDKTGSWIKNNGREFIPSITVPSTDAAREWQGWGTALKPAYEPIVVARKPLIGTVIQNVLQHGTGAINIDGCRIPTKELITNHARGAESAISKGKYGDSAAQETHQTEGQKNGRFPTNIIHDGSDEVVNQFPMTESGELSAAQQINGGFKGSKNCYGTAVMGGTGEYKANIGSAARFFYCAKASPSERGKGNNHPTVKPAALIEYLVKLVSREGQIVLDPFFGSGTTGLVCSRLNRDYIGIELNGEYVEMAKRRIEGDAPLLNRKEAK